jgi:hypothetical protein
VVDLVEEVEQIDAAQKFRVVHRRNGTQ